MKQKIKLFYMCKTQERENMYIQFDNFKGAWKIDGNIYVLKGNATVDVFMPISYDVFDNLSNFNYAKKAFTQEDKVFKICGYSSYSSISSSLSDFIVFENILYHVNVKFEPTISTLSLVEAINKIEGIEQIPVNKIALIKVTSACSSSTRTLIENNGSVFTSFNNIIKITGLDEIKYAATLGGIAPIKDLFFTLGDKYFCATTEDDKYIGLSIEVCSYEKYYIAKCELSDRLCTSYRLREFISPIDNIKHKFSIDTVSEIAWSGDYMFRNEYMGKAKELFGITGFRYCQNCGSIVGIVNIESNNGQAAVCDECYTNGWRVCSCCKNTFNVNDLPAPYDAFINGKWYCEDCNPNIPTLPMRSYGYKPEPKFVALEDEPIDVNTVFAGVELEVGDSCSERALRRLVASRLTAEQREFVYPKHDGSLCSEGVEFVTHPMTRKYHLESSFWDNMCDGISDGGGTNDSAGLHIHISRNPLTFEQQSRIIYFVNKYKEFFKDFSRRYSSEFRDWCLFKAYDSTECTRETKPRMAKYLEEEGCNRYSSVNDCNENTLEFRFFKAFYDPTWIRACIDMVYAIVDLVISVPDSEPFEKTPSDLYSFFNSEDTNKWCTKAGYDLAREREWVANDFIEPVKIKDKLNMIPGETYMIHSNTQSAVNSPMYSRFSYNHEWYAYRWACEHIGAKVTFLASMSNADGNNWYAFHMSSRLSPSERWNGTHNINRYPDEFLNNIRAVASEHNWDEAARVIILHESEFNIYNI